MTSTRSAAGSGLPASDIKYHLSELGGAIQDAVCMAEVAHAYIGDTLGYSGVNVPRLSDHQAALVYWLLCQTSYRINEAQNVYERVLEVKR